MPIRRLRPLRRPASRVAFSYPLFFIAILHFTVFSIGVCENQQTAQHFFLRENSNFKTFNNFNSIEKQLQLHHISLAALLQQFKEDCRYIALLNTRQSLDCSNRQAALDKRSLRGHTGNVKKREGFVTSGSEAGEQTAEEAADSKQLKSL